MPINGYPSEWAWARERAIAYEFGGALRWRNVQKVVVEGFSSFAVGPNDHEGRLTIVGIDLDELVGETGLNPVTLDDLFQHPRELGDTEDATSAGRVGHVHVGEL